MEKIKIIFFYGIVVSLLCAKAAYPASQQSPSSSPFDKTPPSIALIFPQEGFVVEGGKKLALAGKITDDAGLKSIKIYNGKDYTEYGVSGKEIDLSRYAVDLTQRTYGKISIGVYAYDMSGKSSNKVISVELRQKYPGGDKGGPVVSLTSPSVGQVVSGKVRLAGTVTDQTDLKSIDIYNGVRSQTYAVSGKMADLSNYSVDFTGLAGLADFGVSAFSVTGKRGHTYYSLNIPGEGDRFPPIITVHSPREGETIRGAGEIKLRGTVTDDVGLRSIDIYSSGRMVGLSPLYNVSGKSVDLSNYPVDISFMNGKGHISITASDAAGRFSWKRINLHVIPPDDRYSPVVNLTYPINGQTLQAGKVTFKGTVADDVNLQKIAFTALAGSEGAKKIIAKAGTYRISGRKVDLSNYSLDLTGFEGQAEMGIGVEDASGKRTIYPVTVVVKKPR